MAIGAKDKIDALLVKKYQGLKVDNPVIQSSMIDPDKMLEAMNDYAMIHMNALNLQQQLKSTCIKAISLNIQYRKSKNIKMRKPAQAVK